LEQQ
jgi:myotubularin-related protein 6/7/8